ncbi:MAG TPA: chemotaxis protein CheB, partial [Thermoleophilia bacterium]|nr:chemotaxis protein CheB [Thermoleophilia bacterium]
MDDRVDEGGKPKDDDTSGSPPPPRHFLTVGIGASAGGLEALQRFFASTPPDSGIAFVLVEHLDPHHETMMPELLARSTAMPVEQIKDGTPVEPNHVYIIPPNATLTIEAGILRVQKPQQPHGYRTPVDKFLRSLAQDQSNSAVAIILSGTGSDGSLGLVSVKENGGFTLVQEPETAKYDSMPRSAIATGHVDEVLPVEDLPGKLLQYSRYWTELVEGRGPQVIQAEATDHFARICALVRQRTGHDFTLYKKGTFTRRLGRRMQAIQINSVADYVERLELDPAEADRLFKDLLIRVTQFFRDPEAFERLDKLVLPKILASKGAGDQVRIWVPGCATGEEAYSVAILVSEQLRSLQSSPQVHIFATDIDEQALQVGRQGRYPEGIADQISRERLDNFFLKEDGAYRVTNSLRERCIFSTQNLIKDPPFSGLDLITCRNLLIYLEPELQKRILHIMHYALRPDGFLFLGTSENISAQPQFFLTVDKKYRLFQRKEAPWTPLPLPLFDYSRGAPMLPGGQLPVIGQQKSGLRQPDLEEIAGRLVMEHYAPPWVIINEKSDAVFFSSRIDKYLSPALGAANLNIINMARKGLRLDLRTAIHRVLRTGEPTVRRDVLVETAGGVVRVNLHVRPMAEVGEHSGLLVAVFDELGPVKSPPQKAAAGSHHDEEALIHQLEFELKSTKENLQATVEEMETSNEELKSSNEELLSLNEELQSSNEELQTSKEELQSVNEELQTVNGELRAKVDELDRTNSDLDNLFRSTQIATLFLDHDLRIKKFTPATK